MRRKRRPQGRPSFVRVDTVYSGDRDGEKGVFVIKMVDEVTQYQQLAVVPRITEYFLVSVLEALVTAFLFRVLGFHADNGSEYVNHRIRPPAQQAPRRPASLPGAEGFLKPGITFQELDRAALAVSGLDAAKHVQRARKALFRLVANALSSAA